MKSVTHKAVFDSLTPQSLRDRASSKTPLWC